MAKETETRALRRGDVLVRQGDPADDLFIVLTGRFAVTKEGRRDPIAEIGPEQPIGEIAFLTGGTRTATVTAMRDSVVLRLSRTEFDLLTAKCPSIWRTLTNTLSHRLAATTALGASSGAIRGRARLRSSAPAKRQFRPNSSGSSPMHSPRPRR